jgi:5-formyltetrahydrofolate cyclo-ligase
VDEDALRVRVKAELRKRMRAVRKAAAPESCRERSARIVASLLALPFVGEAGAVALFWPIAGRNEVDLVELDAILRGRGVRVAYPSIDPDRGEMRMRFVEDPRAMAVRGRGFAEPASSDPLAERLDIVIVPALAVDPAGHRIGYGAGWYDRTLPVYCPPAVAVSVAYDYQVMVDIPHTLRDVRTGWIVTDARTLEAEEARG